MESRPLESFLGQWGPEVRAPMKTDGQIWNIDKKREMSGSVNTIRLTVAEINGCLGLTGRGHCLSSQALDQVSRG